MTQTLAELPNLSLVYEATAAVAPGLRDVVMWTPCPVAVSTIRGLDNGGHAADRSVAPPTALGLRTSSH